MDIQLANSSASGAPWYQSHHSETTTLEPHNITGKPWPLFRQSAPMVVLLSFSYFVVFVVGLVNNCLVVSVIYRNRQMRTVTNYFIANLAIADILVCIFVMPITLLASIFTEWWYGPVLCKAAPYLQGVAVSASVHTLAAVAVERYLAIFYPKTSKMTARTATVIIGVIWLVPLCIFSPWLVVYTQKTFDVRHSVFVGCTADWRSVRNRRLFTIGAVFLSCYLLPLLFVASFYALIGVRVWRRHVRGMLRGGSAQRHIHRAKIRVLRMLVTVVVTFALSWLPLYLLELRVLSVERPSEMLRSYLVPLAQWLGAANSCVNPFIYCYFSENFRRGIIAVVRSRSLCGKIIS